jgi:large subunit ribosomal protein L13
MKTYSQKPADVSRAWYVIDAAAMPLGRLATVTASLLLGKRKSTVTAHVDGGDFVIVINAAAIQTTGGKSLKKTYYRHSGYPGGLYARSLDEQKSLDPKKVIYKAVRGMLPDNKLRQARLGRLKIYEGAQHDHAAQKPEILTTKEKV